MKAKGNPWYDDVALINVALESKGLEGLHDVIKARREAVFVTNESGIEERVNLLNTFVVNATWWLDTFGQVSFIRNICHRYDHRRPVDPKLIAALPMVMSEIDFVKALPKDTTYECAMGGSQTIPPVEHACTHCGKGWTLVDADTCHVDYGSVVMSGMPYVGRTIKEMREKVESSKDKQYYMGHGAEVKNPKWIDNTPIEGYFNLKKNEMGFASFKKERDYDVIIDRDAYIIQEGDEVVFHVKTFYHSDCRETRLTEDFLEHCEKQFEQANIPITGKLPVKNAYGSASYRGDWWLITTPSRILRIGWRKRVIECQVMKQDEDEYGNVRFVTDGLYKHVDNYDELREHLIELHLPESLKLPVL